jgi:hypothetical protein
MLKAFSIAILGFILPAGLLRPVQAEKTTEDPVKLQAYIYNQDLDVTLNTRDGRSFPIKIHPKAVLQLEPAPTVAGKTVDIELSVFDRENNKLFEGRWDKVPVKPNSFSVDFKFPQKLASATYAVVNLILDKLVVKKTVELLSHRVSGQVTDFSGNPSRVKAYVIFEADFNNFVAGTVCDQKGHYEMILPARRYHTVWAVDENYGNSTLERYAHNVEIENDTEMDFRIGQIELYRLSATVTAERTIVADFSIFSVHHFIDKTLEDQKRTGKKLSPIEVVADLKYYPALDRESVQMYVDEKPVEVWTVEQRFSSLKQYGNEKLKRPYWIVEGRLQGDVGKGRHILKVVVTNRADENGQVIFEKGEASYNNLQVW